MPAFGVLACARIVGWSPWWSVADRWRGDLADHSASSLRDL